MENNHIVYILRCRDQSLYTGYTNNLEARLKKHEVGKGAKYTRGRGPFKLEYTKSFETKREALQQEYRIKQLSRVKKEQWIAETLEGEIQGENTEKL
ncbi:GIY-YIG nuclease family protein [Halobacillus halophilus]|uniref:GIY-YIG nuclease family protein n=1 Tax=Halobacillus halophilus TaxID=1570 RepID=UPI001CD592F6|nr:GIY-YIG nuclease family protein [Halobacillus halophilus]MCA1012961.1 GIY-YIG nuclease family protein [Halobacillus halophilus]